MNIFPLCYLAPVPYFSFLMQEKEVSIEVSAHYIKQQLSNRTVIKTSLGVLPLTIPIARHGEGRALRDKKIANETPWQKIHWRSLVTAYRNSPYFEYYEDRFVPFYEKKYDFLLDFNMELQQTCCKILKINTKIILTEEYQSSDCYEKDYRNSFDPSATTLPEDYKAQPYTQVFGDFTPGLSIIDLILNAGPKGML